MDSELDWKGCAVFLLGKWRTFRENRHRFSAVTTGELSIYYAAWAARPLATLAGSKCDHRAAIVLALDEHSYRIALRSLDSEQLPLPRTQTGHGNPKILP